MGRFSYVTGNRAMLLAIFGVLLIVGSFAVLYSTTSPPSQPLWFIGLWFVILVWNAYWFLWRFSYRVDVDGDRLTWHAPFRSGELMVTDVQEVGTWWFRQMGVISVRDQRPILCLTKRGFPEFAEALVGDRAIHVDAQLSLGDRLGGFGTKSAFTRYR